MQAKEVALSPRRRRTETNWFVALGATEISGIVDRFPNNQKYQKRLAVSTGKRHPPCSNHPFKRLPQLLRFRDILISRLLCKRLRV
jgi:hypothetical protein